MGARVTTALTCIEGKAWPAVTEWLSRNHRSVEVDLVTAPGISTWLAQGGGQAVRAAVKMSVAENGSVAIAVAGHTECAAGPEDEDMARNHIRTAVEEVASWGLGVPVVGLYVDAKRVARKVVEM